MKIGISIRLMTAKTGGLQYHTEKLAENLRAKGHSIKIVTRTTQISPSYHDAFFHNDAQHARGDIDRDIETLRFPGPLRTAMWLCSKCVVRPRFAHLGIKIYNRIFAAQIARAFSDREIIHHIGQGAEMIGFAASRAAQKLEIPFTVQPTIHPGQWGDSAFDFQLYKRADGLLVHTEYERRYMEGHGLQTPIFVVGNGIEDRSDGVGSRFRQKYSLSGKIILFIGRKEEDKGYMLLRESFDQLSREIADLHLVCIGPGTGIGGNKACLNLDYVDEQTKHDALAACDIFCVPSEAESFGLVYMEAGRYGKPVIARNIPVLRELLGDSALLIGLPGHDNAGSKPSASELAQTCKQLLNDPLSADKLGTELRQRSKLHTWGPVTQRFSDAFQAMVFSHWESRP